MSQCGIQTDLPAGHSPRRIRRRRIPGRSGYPFNAGQVIKLHSEYQNDTGSRRRT